MDTNQSRDAPEVKTHEEILAMLRELDILEERIKNPGLTLEVSDDTVLPLQDVEQAELVVEPTTEPQPEVPTESLREGTPPTKRHVSLLEYYRTQRVVAREPRHRFSQTKKNVSEQPATKLSRNLRKRKTTEKPTSSTFNLYITEEGALAGLDNQRPKPPKPEIRLFTRHQQAESAEQAQEPGFKGKMKRVVSKIIPRRSKTTEAATGIGSRLKGIVKRKP
ncbi:MAG TPA: hypothetical protein VMT57_04150 [Candidatus Thermoplasmatota archaeon]|nr:hypothetical protein [Candidatus Thermoplasmatota archaeon]